MSERRDNELEIERMRLQYASDAQSRRIQFYTMIFTAVMAVVTPVLLHFYHVDTSQKVDAAKTEITEVKKEAKDAASKAAQAHKSVESEAAKLEKKVDANLLQWKAYNSKEPEDMNKAAEAIARAEKPNDKP